MNGVQIYVSPIPNNPLIVLNGLPLDLFDDESILITMKQQDIKDIAVNYTDFTQTFTVPPTAANNKVFKYWYDIKNQNQLENSNGLPARIDIGGVYFRKGLIKVNSVNYNDDGQLKSYTIQFTAGLKALKELFGDKKLADLDYSNSMGGSPFIPWLDIDLSGINGYFERTTTGHTIEVPLISSNRYLPPFSKMTFVSNATKNPDALKRTELRPAIKVDAILSAIQEKFDVDFEGGFFNTNLNVAGKENLYLWLNKNDTVFNSGGVVVKLDTNFTPISNTVKVTKGVAGQNYFTMELNYVPVNGGGGSYPPNTMPNVMHIRFDTLNLGVSTTVDYICKIQEVVLNSDGTVNETATYNQLNFGVVSQSSDYIKGTRERAVEWRWDLINTALQPGLKRHFRILIEAKDNGYFVINSGRIYVNQLMKEKFIGLDVHRIVSTANLTTVLGTEIYNRVSVNENLPELTVYDFLSSLIKMFNLVAIPKLNNVFQFEYYNDYYNSPSAKVFDITEFVFPNRKINKVKTYKSLTFKHDDSEYGSNIQYKKYQPEGREYGSISQAFPNGDAEDYKVESKFNLMLFRELSEIGFTAIPTLQQTWIVGDGVGEKDGDIVSNKPTLFYLNGKANVIENKFLCYAQDDGTSIKLERYSQFSNVDRFDDYRNSLCFSSEYVIDGNIRDKSLYKVGYEKQISKTYSNYSREFEIEAYLPKWIITTIKLNDVIKIDNILFQINEIEINLTTRKTKMKLLNQ